MRPKLWIRKLECGHKRPTNLSFLAKDYEKPKIGEMCYCRQCFEDSKIIDVEEKT